MDLREKCLRFGAVVIISALVVRIFAGSIGQWLLQKDVGRKAAALLLYLETGRLTPPAEETAPETTAPSDTMHSTLPPPTEATEPELPVFAPEDAALVAVQSTFSYQADIDAFLQMPLTWELSADAPTVLILHTHATESYKKTDAYTETTDYRTLNEHYNMVSVGEYLAACLEEKGIGVLHARTLHDYPSYNDAYNYARKTISQYLEEYPSIRLVLDLHRDSVADAAGNQKGETVTTDQGEAARVMLVVGTDASGAYHPHWEENMSLAVKLHARLEQLYPGICRPISLRTQRYNQDLLAGTLLIEVGAAGNTREEALLAAQLLSQCLSDLSHGVVTANSTS